MSKRISEERLEEIIRHSNCDEEECWRELRTLPATRTHPAAKVPELPLLARELLALRASHGELVKALDWSLKYADSTGVPDDEQDNLNAGWDALEAARMVGA